MVCYALPNKAQRAINGQSHKLSLPAGSAEARTVEGAQERHALRTKRMAGGYLKPPAKQAEGICEEPLGQVPTPKFAGVAHKENVMDLFAGEAGVSKASERLGFKAKYSDLKYGPSHYKEVDATEDTVRDEKRQGGSLHASASLHEFFGRPRPHQNE